MALNYSNHGSGLLSFYLFLSPQCHFPPKHSDFAISLTHTQTHTHRSHITNLFAVLCLIPSILSLLPSSSINPAAPPSLHPPSLVDAFLFSPFHLCRIIHRLQEISEGTAHIFPYFCFKGITITDCFLSPENRHCSFFFRQPV